MCNESENTTRPNPETKEAFFRMASAAVAYLQQRNEEDLACHLAKIIAGYQQAKSFDRNFTMSFQSVLSYIRTESLHFEKIGRGLFEAHHGRSTTGEHLFVIDREVAPPGALHGDTPEADIDNLYVEYAHKLAHAIASQEDAEALLLAITEAIEQHLRKELSDFNRIQQMSRFRVLLQELIGQPRLHKNALRWLPPDYDQEFLADLDGLAWYLKYNGYYSDAVLVTKVALDTAIKLCGSDGMEAVHTATTYAQILAETGDYLSAAKYGFQPLQIQAKAVIALLQEADEKTQWQNEQVDNLRNMLKGYIDLLLQAPLQFRQKLANLVYWRHLIRAQELMRTMDSSVSITEKIDALVPLASEAV